MLIPNSSVNRLVINKAVSYQDIYAFLNELYKKSCFFTVHSQRMRVTQELDLYLKAKTGDEVVLPMTYSSLSQLCTFLGIPPQYIRKCYNDSRNRHLSYENVNAWLEVKDDLKVLLNTNNGVCYGILSNTYYVVTDDSLFLTFSQAYPEDEFEVVSVEMGVERLNLTVRSRTPLTVPSQDAYYPAVTLKNSCVGKNSIVLASEIYIPRLNTHISLPKIPRKKFLSKIVEMTHSNSRLASIEYTIKDSRLYYNMNVQTVTDIINYLITKEIDADTAVKLIDNLSDNFSYTKEMLDKIKEKVQATQPRTHWQFIEAVSTLQNEDLSENSKDNVDRSMEYLVAFGLKN